MKGVSNSEASLQGYFQASESYCEINEIQSEMECIAVSKKKRNAPQSQQSILSIRNIPVFLRNGLIEKYGCWRALSGFGDCPECGVYEVLCFYSD